jgi:N-acetylmuramoyl-L-alanine amidase
MYEQFSNLSYLNSSLSSFSYLFAHHPGSIYIHKALYYTGLIHYKYRNDKDRASEIFNTLIQKYPKSIYVEEAKKMLDILARSAVPMAMKSSGNQISTLTDLRYWSSPDYTRVVIYLNSSASFKNQRLYNPDRLYFDFDRTRISTNIAEWMMVVEDNFLKRVRIAHFDQSTTRVVLDMEKVGNYSVFSLTEPDRLVIDITSADYEKKSLMPELAKLGEQPVQTQKDIDQPEKSSGENVNGNSNSSNNSENNQPEKNGGTQEVTVQANNNNVDNTNNNSNQTASSKEPTVTIVPMRNSSGSYSIVRQLGLGVTTIVLDPGHGGKDPGAIIKKGAYEKDLVLDFAFRLKNVLEKDKKYQVYLTRSSDEFIPLEERTAKAMQYKADIFISLHMNTNRHQKLAGLETYYLGFATDRQTEALAAQENAINEKSIGELQEILKLMVGAKVEESKDIALIINSSMISNLKTDFKTFTTRGIKQAPFIVLLGASMPSILMELGYLSNPNEGDNLLTPYYRQRLAEALASSIEEYSLHLRGN